MSSEPAQAQWFPCEGCDRVVTGGVRGDGPKNAGWFSRTHCCLDCERGEGHHGSWCAGVPGRSFREVRVPRSCPAGPLAHYLIHEPDWNSVSAPVPALLFLHGACTFTWPETLWPDVDELVRKNELAKDFVVVAPFASKGEPIAEESTWRWKPDRYGNELPYVDSFKADLTWECFLGACEALGPDKVDFSRICITGYSMGGQATWDIAVLHGSKVAAIAPVAGSCAWPHDAWNRQEQILQQLKNLPILSYSIQSDDRSYNWKDHIWLAQSLGRSREPERAYVDFSKDLPGVDITTWVWADNLKLGLMNVKGEGHNCWETLYHNERLFGLFRWMASRRNELAEEELLRRLAPTGEGSSREISRNKIRRFNPSHFVRPLRSAALKKRPAGHPRYYSSPDVL